MLNVAVIGMGLRARGVFTVLYTMGDVRLAAVCDPRDRAELQAEIEKEGIDFSGTAFYTDAEDMLSKEKNLDGVIVGTRCSLHTHFAVKVLEKKIPLFLEKPVSTGWEDFHKLQQAYKQHQSPVIVSFPLRRTPLIAEVKSILNAGEIGEIHHLAAFNYVTYGGDYYHSWYRDEQETGGLFLQKATHDFDYINYLVEMNPTQLCAMKSKQLMKGSRPAGLLCSECDERDTCPEGPFQITQVTGDYVHGPYCCYAEDTGNEDSGTAIIRYENGMHAVYTQNFFVRNKHAARRGAILAGAWGTLEFDWITSEIKVTKHYKPGYRVYHVESTGNHGGGDFVLMQNFLSVMRGQEPSHTPMEEGLRSCYLCLKAKESAETGTFMDLSGIKTI